MQPGSYLAPELQNLFTLGYFQGVRELVPTGWNQVDDEKTYPTLASRSPQIYQTGDESGNDFEMSGGQTGSETSNDDDNSNENIYGSTTRMNEESDEDELALPANHRRVSCTNVNVPLSSSFFLPLQLLFLDFENLF